jgi:hypothetical protein
VPFTTYETFAGAELRYDVLGQNSFSVSDSNGLVTYTASYGDNFTEVSYTASGTALDGETRILFIEDAGISVSYLGGGGTLYPFVSDEFVRNRFTSTENTDYSYLLRLTTETTLTSTIVDSEVTWTDVTTESSETSIIYTDITAYTTYGTDVEQYGNLFIHFSGEGLVIQPHYGRSWTQDGYSLQYLQIFSIIGLYNSTYSGIVKDNTADASTFSAIKSLISYNTSVSLGGANATTIINSSARTITFDTLEQVQDTLTISTSYDFYDHQFHTISDFVTSRTFYKLQKVSKEFTYSIQSKFAIQGSDGDSGDSSGVYTATRPVEAYTTDTFYAIDAVSSYFSSFTYRGRIKTTTTQTYIVYDGGTFFSSTGSNTNGGRNGITLFQRPTQAYVGFYSLEIGSADDAWRKYYTQYSPNFNFVVGGTSDSIGGYKANLNPTSLITKLYFTTYKFERHGAINAPILAIPIDYTSESGDETISYTYQSVNVPSGFCLGSSSASVYWTKFIDGQTTNTTSSFTLVYAGSNSILTMGELTQNDFSGDVGGVPYDGGIYHTIGLVNTSSGASWSKDGYYYWKSTARDTVGSTAEAISVVGDGNPITFIASCLTSSVAYPVVSIVKSYANSYSY